jgi:hypothetical protein
MYEESSRLSKNDKPGAMKQTVRRDVRQFLYEHPSATSDLAATCAGDAFMMATRPGHGRGAGASAVPPHSLRRQSAAVERHDRDDVRRNNVWTPRTDSGKLI